MAFQDKNPLVMQALSVLDDKPPGPPVQQPHLDDGIHLRWSPGMGKGFPAKGGYYLFRRRTDGPVCLMQTLESKSPTDLQSVSQITTEVGTLSTANSQPFAVSPSGASVEGILFSDPNSLRFVLPAGVFTREVSVNVRFLGEGPTTVETGFQKGLDPRQPPAPIIKSGVSYQPVGPNGQPEPFAAIVSGVEDPDSDALMCLSRVEVTLPTPTFFCRVVIGKGGAKVEVFEDDGTLAQSVQYLPDEWGTKEFSGQGFRKIVITGEGIRIYRVDYDLPLPQINVAAVGSLKNVDVALKVVSGTWRDEATAVIETQQDLDSIKITGGPAELLDLCYTPVAAPESGTAISNVPGRSWEAVPNFTYPLVLPIVHPAYPASSGPESIETSLTMAKARLRYGSWTASFNAVPPQAGTGTATFTSGSAIVAGSGTQWTSTIVGSLICLAKTGTDFVAYVIMTVLAPDRLVLSRPFSGNTQINAPYQLIAKPDTPDGTSDDFAELHDQLACLFQSIDDMRAATAPPVLDQGTVAAGKFVRPSGGPLTIQGVGTTWTQLFEGAHIEIGPKWFAFPFPFYVEELSVCRIVSVDVPNQAMTLDGAFPGPLTFKADFRILARSSKDQDAASFLELQPMEMIELASLKPSYAQVLGLYWIDATAERGGTYDYIILADFEDRFKKQSLNALTWLNGPPDSSSNKLDTCLVKGVKHLGSPPLQPPSQIEAFRLPGWGVRATIPHPDRADSDVGISVQDVATWKDPNTPQPTPVMLSLWRLARGTTTLLPVGNDATGYDDLGLMIPSVFKPNPDLKRPEGWPQDPARPIHFIDSGSDGTGLDVGWYTYRANNIDIFGRWSGTSDPIPWVVVAGKAPGPFTATTIGDSVHLQDLVAPPPPAGVLACMLDDRDPYLVRDAAFNAWRINFPATPPVVGIRIQWRWLWAYQNQGPDLREFRIYFLSAPLNVRTGTVTSVVAGSKAGHSVVTLNIAADAYTGASLQVASRSFPILGSSGTTNVQLTVQNGGAKQNEPPAVNVAGAIVIPNGHALAKNLLDPRNWQWLAAVPQNLAGTKFDVQMVEDPVAITVDAPANTFTGALATWNGAAFVLDAIPSPHTSASVRPGIDVLALTSATASFVVQIQSISGLQIIPVPASLPTPAPLVGTQFQWQIGPTATWNGTVFELTGMPAVVRPGIDVLALTSAAASFVVEIQSVSGSQIVPLAASLPIPAPVAGTQFQWQLGPVTTGLQGNAATWDATNNILTLDGTHDLSGVHVGTDLVYVAVAGATPAGLNYFQTIDAVVGNTLKLSGTPAQLGALTPGPLAWQIGQPVRHYEVFLKVPPGSAIMPATGLDISKLIPPNPTQPVVHGMVSVSSADWRDEITDQVMPARNRNGNEGKLSGPAPVFRVLWDTPPVPVSVWKTPLVATKANYKSESYFTVRWNNPLFPPPPPGAGYFAHVLRAIDSSLFLALWKLSPSPSPSLPTTGAPVPIAAFLTSFNTHQMQYILHTNAAAVAPANSALAQAEAALAQADYQAAAALFAPLDDASLFWLAGRPELADAYMQITIKPLDLSDPANADRLGPDDALPFTANTAACAYVDTLPGRSTNKYFYRVMLLDGAQNRSQLGDPSPPVYVPKVVPPRTPLITKVLGGDRQITIQWAPNREPELAKYRVYRTDSKEAAGDVRSMTLVGTLAKTDAAYVDTSCPTLVNVYYRMVAVDTAGNVSVPSTAVLARAFDESRPDPPVWNPAVAGSQPGSRALSWTSPITNFASLVQRRQTGQTNWLSISNWLARGIYAFTDPDRAGATSYEYRLIVMDAGGRQNIGVALED